MFSYYASIGSNRRYINNQARASRPGLYFWVKLSFLKLNTSQLSTVFNTFAVHCPETTNLSLTIYLILFFPTWSRKDFTSSNLLQFFIIENYIFLFFFLFHNIFH